MNEEIPKKMKRFSDILPSDSKVLGLTHNILGSLWTSLKVQTRLVRPFDVKTKISEILGGDPKEGKPRAFIKEFYPSKDIRMEFIATLSNTRFMARCALHSTDTIYYQGAIKYPQYHWIPSVSVMESSLFPIHEKKVSVTDVIENIHHDMARVKGSPSIQVDTGLILDIITAAIIHADSTGNLTEEEIYVVLCFIAIYAVSNSEMKECAVKWFCESNRSLQDIDKWYSMCEENLSLDPNDKIDSQEASMESVAVENESGVVVGKGDCKVETSADIAHRVTTRALVVESSLSPYAAIYTRKPIHTEFHPNNRGPVPIQRVNSSDRRGDPLSVLGDRPRTAVTVKPDVLGGAKFDGFLMNAYIE